MVDMTLDLYGLDSSPEYGIYISSGKVEFSAEMDSRLEWKAAHLFCSMLSCGSPVVKASDHGRHVMSSSPVPQKTRRVGQRCTLHLSRAETSSHWYGVVVRRGGASSGVVHVT
ncbi:uncharacterized protein TNCV_2895881 [Trichonephila clavipes]|nr:uncharacterized protein TNCV_2895881 [Trichonephila clavipes]